MRERISRDEEQQRHPNALTAAGPGRREQMVLAMQRTHGNAHVSRAVQQIRRREAVDAPELDQMTAGLSQEQYLAVSTWTTQTHHARTRMEMKEFPAAMVPLNELDQRMSAFAQKWVQTGKVTLPAGQKLALATAAFDEARVSVGALAGKRRDNVREAWQMLHSASTGLEAAATNSDKLDDGEKLMVSSYGAQVGAGAAKLQSFEPDTPTVQGVMENTLPMLPNLHGMAEKAPGLQAAAKLIDDADRILQAIVNPKGAELEANLRLSECESAIMGALALPIWRPEMPSRIVPTGLGPKTEIHPE